MKISTKKIILYSVTALLLLGILTIVVLVPEIPGIVSVIALIVTTATASAIDNVLDNVLYRIEQVKKRTPVIQQVELSVLFDGVLISKTYAESSSVVKIPLNGAVAAQEITVVLGEV